jgi:hypothetical protein
MSLFQDICFNYVYSYANSLTTPVGYDSVVGGILTNGAIYDNFNGAINGNDISMNASKSQYMSIQQIPIFPIATDGSGFSFSGWFYPVGTQSSPVVLFDLSGAGLARSSVLYNGTNTLSTYYNGGNVGNTTIGQVLPSMLVTPGQWHFFCYTVRCTNVSGTFMAKESLYIDASCMTNQFATDATTPYVPFTIQTATIGGKPTVAGSYFNGHMSEMRYYGRVLTNPEVQVLYNMQNYINYHNNLSVYNPASLLGKYNSVNGGIIKDGIGQYGATVQIDLSGTFSYMDVSRNPGFNGGTTRTLSNLYASSLTSTSTSLSVDQSGNVFFLDTTVSPNQTYTYFVTPHIRDISNTSTVVTTTAGVTTITTPPITLQLVLDISAGTQTSKNTGMLGSMIQVDVSGIFSVLDITRNPPFNFSVSPPAPIISPGTFTSGTGVLVLSATSVLNTPSTLYQSYLLNTLTYTNSSNPTQGILGLAFVDMTAVPGVTYTYSFTPSMVGSANYKTAGTISNIGSITAPPVTILPKYDISAGAIIGNDMGKYGATVQIDLSGSFTYVDISRNPAFITADLSLLSGTNSYRVYDASASLSSTDNAYITNAMTYTNHLLPTSGIMGEVFVDKTAYPNMTYSYYITPSIKGTNGAITTASTSTGITTITTPPVTLQYAFFDPSFGMVLNTNGASVQIDLSGNITGVDISRNPAFPESLTANNILEFTYASSLVAPVNNLAYLTNTQTYQNVTGLAFVDNTALQNNNYTYYVSPYIKSVFGIIYQATTVLGVVSSISTSTVTSGLGTVNPAIVPTPGTVSTTTLSSSSIPGVTIDSGGSSGGGGGGSGTDGGSGTGSGSAGTVTSTTLTGGTLDGTGISATGGAPTLPSPVAGAVSLASGAVTSLYTGTLPSTVTTYYVVTMNLTGSTTISQTVTILAPPVGFSGASGTISFYAWPSSTYDSGTTLTVTMGGTTLLSGFTFSGPNTPVATLNLPFVNFPAGSTFVNFIITNTNSSSNSQICLSGLNVNYSFIQGSGTTVIDTSNLALYYPLDSSAGTLLSNYASGNPITDASLCSGAVINTTGIIPSCIGLGDVSFNQSLGSYAQLGKWTCPPAINNNGFTIAGWVCPAEDQYNNATICSLSNNTTSISIFLNKTNLWLDFSCNMINQPEYIAQANLIPNTWNFFTMVCTCTDQTQSVPYSTFTYYLNGISMATAYGYYPNTSSIYTNNYLGGLPVNSSSSLSSLNGHIDDFRIYNRVLSNSEIQGLWMYGMTNAPNNLHGNIIDSTSLIMYYTFIPSGSYPTNGSVAPGSRMLIIYEPTSIIITNITFLSNRSFSVFWTGGINSTTLGYDITAINLLTGVELGNLNTKFTTSDYRYFSFNDFTLQLPENLTIGGLLFTVDISGTNTYGTTVSSPAQYAPITTFTDAYVDNFYSSGMSMKGSTIHWTGGYGYNVTYSYNFSGTSSNGIYIGQPMRNVAGSNDQSNSVHIDIDTNICTTNIFTIQIVATTITNTISSNQIHINLV